MLVVDDESTWPLEFRDAVATSEILKLFESYEWMDRLIEESNIRHLCRKVDQYAETSSVAGYHCTKAINPDRYREQGLRVLEMDQHHKEVLSDLRDIQALDGALVARIEQVLTDFRVNHHGRREGMLWFCLAEVLPLSDGCDRFFEYLGGEAIYWPFIGDEEVNSVLRRIGQPVVVKARLQFHALTIYREYALGRCMLSLCASRVNPQFNVEFAEGHVSGSVAPEDVLEVYDAVEFKEQVGLTSPWARTV